MAGFVRGGVGDADDAAVVGRLLGGEVVGDVAVGEVAAVEARHARLRRRDAERGRGAADEDAGVGRGRRAGSDHVDGERSEQRAHAIDDGGDRLVARHLGSAPPPTRRAAPPRWSAPAPTPPASPTSRRWPRAPRRRPRSRATGSPARRCRRPGRAPRTAPSPAACTPRTATQAASALHFMFRMVPRAPAVVATRRAHRAAFAQRQLALDRAHRRGGARARPRDRRHRSDRLHGRGLALPAPPVRAWPRGGRARRGHPAHRCVDHRLRPGGADALRARRRAERELDDRHPALARQAARPAVPVGARRRHSAHRDRAHARGDPRCRRQPSVVRR